MAYSLTLSSGEREAFDWVGGRYATGDEVGSLLRDCLPEGKEWDDDGDIEFDVPEHVAWEIDRLAKSEDGTWTCFDDELRDKMIEFCDDIV